MNLTNPSMWLLQHILLLPCILCNAVGGSVDSEISFSYPSDVSTPVDVGASAVGFIATSEAYDDPNMALAGGKKSRPGSKSSRNDEPKSKSSKKKGPKPPKNHAPTPKPTLKKKKRTITMKPTQAPTTAKPTANPTQAHTTTKPTINPTHAPTTAKQTHGPCPEFDNPFRTCYNGTGFVNSTPVLAEDEVLTNGSMYVATVVDFTDDEWFCSDTRKFEEITVLWLQDDSRRNETNETILPPVCAFVMGYNHSTWTDKETTIRGIAFKMQLFYIEKNASYAETLKSVFERRLDGDEPIQPSCESIQSGVPYGSSCVLGRRRLASTEDLPPVHASRSLQSSVQQNNVNMTGNFTSAVAAYVNWTALATGARLIHETSKPELVAKCGALYYAARHWKDYTPLCDWFEDYKCRTVNGFIDYEKLEGEGEKICCENSTTNDCSSVGEQFSFVDDDDFAPLVDLEGTTRN